MPSDAPHAGYLYRHELLEHLTPLLELVGRTPEEILGMHLYPDRLELDILQPATALEPLPVAEFAFFRIGDAEDDAPLDDETGADIPPGIPGDSPAAES